MNDLENLMTLNGQIRDAEFNGDRDFFEKLLTEDFTMRRANGKTVDKCEYLDQLGHTSYSFLESTELQLIPIDNDLEYIITRVIASGQRPDHTDFRGNFRNVKFFRRTGDGWKLYAWHNKEAIKEKGDSRISIRLGDENSFTGTVVIQTLFEAKGRREYQVFFHPSSRTHWHIHTETQQLFIVSGSAIVTMKKEGKETRYNLKSGEKISIPPGILHWHGAGPETYMIHIANNRYSDLENTFWFHHVSNQEYEYTRSQRGYQRSQTTI